MGASNSKTKDTVYISEKARKIEEEERRKALEKYGILIPPAFGVTGTPSQKGTGAPLSVQHRLLQEKENHEPVSYMDYLHETDLSQCLLTDHLETGVWISTKPASHTSVRCSAIPSRVNSKGQLFVERSFDDAQKAVLQLRAEASGKKDLEPSLSGAIYLSNELSIFASLIASGAGWFGGHWDHTFSMHPDVVKQVAGNTSANPFVEDHTENVYEGLDTMSRKDINLKVGAWLPVHWKKPLDLSRSVHQLHGYAAVNMLGATAAFHTFMPIANSNKLQTRTYVSANLNDVDRPPLQITLERDDADDSAQISLTQVFSFDRYQIYPGEDRAPNIRNTFAWTARVTSKPEVPTTEEALRDDISDLEKRRVNMMSLGLAWQVNRGLALKATVQPHNNYELTTAVLLKRWKQPRITCSLMKSWNMNDIRGVTSGWGIGIEIETGDFNTDPESYYYNHHPNATTVLGGEEGCPQTKAALPEDIEMDIRRRATISSLK